MLVPSVKLAGAKVDQLEGIACYERISDQSTCMLPARLSGIFLRLSLIVAPSLSLNGTLGIGFP